MAPIDINNQEISSITLNGNEINTVDVNGQEVFSAGISGGGNKFYELSFGEITQYTLSTPYDLSTASKDGTFSINTSSEQGFCWRPDGTSVYVGERGSQEIDQYDLSTPYDLSTLTFVGSHPTGFNTNGLEISRDGTTVIACSNGIFDIFDLSTPFDITSASNVGGGNESPFDREITFHPVDGSKLYASDRGGFVRQYSLSTPYDITSRSQELDFSVTYVNVQSCVFNDTGDQAVISYYSEPDIEIYSTSGFSLSGATQVGTFTSDFGGNQACAFDLPQ